MTCKKQAMKSGRRRSGDLKSMDRENVPPLSLLSSVSISSMSALTSVDTRKNFMAKQGTKGDDHSYHNKTKNELTLRYKGYYGKI